MGKVKTASGSPSINSGDEVAIVLMGQDPAKLRDIAVENGLHFLWNRWKARMLNPGMMRMNLGNCLRVQLDRWRKDSINNQQPTVDGIPIVELYRAKVLYYKRKDVL